MFSLTKKTKNNSDFMSGNIFPKDYRSDDLFLVEFPKSGITWLSFILANILCEINRKELDVTYYNIQQIVPDLHMSRSVGGPFFEYPGYRLLKSHSVFNRRYFHVIYLLRNPLSVMVSYYNFCCDLELFKGSFESFLEDARFGINAYNRHATSWLCDRKGANRLHLLKYEDLIANPENTIGKLIQNLGWHADKHIIRSSIKKSTLEEMKKTESTYRQFDPCYDQVFVGRSRSRHEQGSLSKKDVETIYRSTKAICDRFYPESFSPGQ